MTLHDVITQAPCTALGAGVGHAGVLRYMYMISYTEGVFCIG